MKIFLLLFVFSYQVMALEVVISNPCALGPHLQTQLDLKVPVTVGELTIKLLQDHQIQFEGSEAGIISIEQTPKSLEALEILNEKSLRSHGWCYTVNEELSSLLVDEHVLEKGDTKLFWYYGYFLMDDNEWSSDCLPAEKNFLDSFCPGSI